MLYIVFVILSRLVANEEYESAGPAKSHVQKPPLEELHTSFRRLQAIKIGKLLRSVTIVMVYFQYTRVILVVSRTLNAR